MTVRAVVGRLGVEAAQSAGLLSGACLRGCRPPHAECLLDATRIRTRARGGTLHLPAPSARLSSSAKSRGSHTYRLLRPVD